MVIFKINGEIVMVDVVDDIFLFWVFCDYVGLIGVKYGCGIV